VVVREPRPSSLLADFQVPEVLGLGQQRSSGVVNRAHPDQA
jgi:hypothetical protein